MVIKRNGLVTKGDVLRNMFIHDNTLVRHVVTLNDEHWKYTMEVALYAVQQHYAVDMTIYQKMALYNERKMIWRVLALYTIQSTVK